MIKTYDLTPRQKKIAVIVAGIVLLYILFGFIGAPFIIRNVLENKVADAIDRQVTVESVRVNPLTLSLTLRNLSVREKDGAPFVNSDEVYANLQTSSLLKWALVLKSVRLVNPDIHLVRSGETTFNFSDIGGGNTPEENPAEASSDSGGFALAVYDTSISGGALSIDDRVVGVSHRIENFSLSISDFSSRPSDTDVYTLFDLAARVNGASFALEGKTRPFDPRRETRAEIEIEDLAVPHYLPYVPLPDNLKIQSLFVKTDTEIEFRMLEGSQPELVVAGVTKLNESRLTDGNDEPFFNYPNVRIDLLPSRVLTGEIRLAELEVSEPEVFLRRLASGDLYLPFLAVKAHDAAATRAEEDPTGEFQPVVTIDRIDLKKGVVHVSDLSNREAFSTKITDLGIEVDNFGLNSDRTARYQLSLETEAKETVALSGTATLSPLQATGELSVEDIQASRYFPYYQDLFAFKVLAGTLSLGGSFRVQQAENTFGVSLAGVHFDVEALEVVDADDDDPLLALKRLEVTDTTADLRQREITVGRLALADADLSVLREKDGSLNLAKAFIPRETAASVASEEEAAQAEPRNAPESSPAPLVVNLKTVDISDVGVAVEDRMTETPFKVRLDEISLSANDLSTAPDTTGKTDLRLRWEQAGQIQATGDVTLNPLALDMAVRVQKMDVRPLQPYLSEQAGLIITEGFFSTSGQMKFTSRTDSDPSITYAGRAGLDRFASIDRKNADDFLKWNALTFENLEVSVNPSRLSIDQISLADFFARVIVAPDGSVNLATMFASQEVAQEPSDVKGDSPAPEAADTEKPPIRISRVLLSGGDVDFSDHFIKPNFRAKFHDLAGKVSGLESIAEKRADVLLEGMWSNHAPVKITGQINPLIAEPYVDLNLNISDIELSPFSPYSGKYLGYVLEKGKLTFNVAYLMENHQLEGKNSIYVDQLTLGDTVDSPEAVSLPIKLAVALLKDREGNIELDLPVSGDLDDPEFKIGKVILTVLKNLIVKLVTSPFAALGSLAGGGEELSYLDFDAGQAEIGQENAQKMDKLAKILFERPGLKLDIQGSLEPEADREALRVQSLENRLKAEKLEEMIKAGESAVPLEEIVMSDEERPVLLEAVFTASALPAPVDDSGKPVELTPQIMESLLLENTEVTPDQYRELANQRAFNAKNYLLETGQVERDRMFIVEPQKGAAEGRQESPEAGRVIFSLK